MSFDFQVLELILFGVLPLMIVFGCLMLFFRMARRIIDLALKK